MRAGKETMRNIVRVSSFLVALGAASVAGAQTPIALTISGNQAQGTISLPGGIAADLTITFENPTGLTATALEATAQVVNPLDAALLARMPADTSIPSEFPVLVHIGPSASSTLTFRSVATVALHTANLEYDTGAPCALVKAHDGGSFIDIITWDGSGSYRVIGSGGDFSEFLIVRDARGIDDVILGKFDALQATLTAHAGELPFLVATTLQTRLTAARTLYLAGSLLPAVSKLTSFTAYVVSHTGSDIPGTWEAADPGQINVAGLLRSAADTLKFSIDRKAGL
jgi:hypothetical protein